MNHLGLVLLIGVIASVTPIAWAESRLTEQPASIQGDLDRATALIRNARKTGENQYYQRAERMAQQVLRQEPDLPDGLRLLAWAQTGQHRFTAALETAQRLRQLKPDDYRVYGLLGDAYVELGDYEQAAAAWQRMMDLRPGPAAYSRVAHLRELYGDPEGAIELMAMAVRAVGSRDPEALAWLWVEYGMLHFEQGRLKVAEAAFDKALAVLPNYYKAMEALAQVRAGQQRYAEAINLYEDVARMVPAPAVIMALGELYQLTGQPEAAETHYQLVESMMQLNRLTPPADHRTMARYYADRGQAVKTAVALIEVVATTHRDIHTYDTLAWVYYKAGRLQDAQKAIQQALRLGTQDAILWYHSGMIEYSLGKFELAQIQLRRALEINPYFSPIGVRDARRVLAQLESPTSALDLTSDM